jgi:hypothetical protein
MHSPTVRSARTKDTQVELNRRRAGEDARVTIERARVRRLNIEGRNLKAELDAAVPKLQGLAQASVAGVGCTTLADHLRAMAWPSKFRPTYRKSTTGQPTHQNCCRSTSPPSRRLGVTMP